MEITPKAMEIEYIRIKRFIDMDKIFSIAPLIDKSFLNISIKKAVPSEDTAFFM